MVKEPSTVHVFIVALPIGNFEDLSPRALQTLKNAQVIFCEDTRKLSELSKRTDLDLSHAELISLPGDQEFSFSFDRVLEKKSKASAQNVWALVSDAGTPTVNDPGVHLIQWASSKGISVRAIPGPAAPMVALQATGGFGMPFVFSGFPPKASGQALTKFFSPLLGVAKTFCFFLSRHDFENVFKFLSESLEFKDRKIFVARELTKPHEEILAGKPAEIFERVSKRIKSGEGLGEMTVLIEGDGKFEQAPLPKIQDWDPREIQKLRLGSPKESAKILSRLTGWQVSDCYEILAVKD